MLSTGGLARATGYSVQQVRDLERLGVIPPATRARNGYRGFSERHVRALGSYRGLAAAVGPVEARRILAALPGLPRDEAVAAIGRLHVDLTRARDETLAALRALDLIRGEPADASDDDAMTITELAAALGVRASTLRFWEDEGLLAPERVGSLGARRYPVGAVRDARIVAALRAAGTRIPEVRALVTTLHTADGDVRGVLQSRLDAIAERQLRLLVAGADVAAGLTETAP